MLESGRFRHPRRPLCAAPTVRNLLIVILVFIGIWWARGALRRFKDQQAIRRKESGKPIAPECMLKCRHCDLGVPEPEGVRAGEDSYHFDAHRLAGQRTD